MEQVKPKRKDIYYDDNGLTTIDQLDRSDYTIIYLFFLKKGNKKNKVKKEKRKISNIQKKIMMMMI